MDAETEIVIFDVQDEETPDATSTRLQYEKLQEESGFSDATIQSIEEIDRQIALFTPPETNVLAILTKYICGYCIPIITAKSYDETKYVMPMQFDIPTLAFVSERKQYVNVPRGEQCFVVGLQFPKRYMRAYDATEITFFEDVGVQEVAISGNYSTVQMQTNLPNEQFAGVTGMYRPMKTAPAGASKAVSAADIYASVLFGDEKTAEVHVMAALEFIKFIEKSAIEHVLPLYAKMEMLAGKMEKTKPIDFHHEVEKDEKKSAIIDRLNNLMFAKINDDDYVMNKKYLLDSNGMSNMFSYGYYLGTDSDEFTNAYAALEHRITIARSKEEQSIKLFSAQLEYMKKDAIAHKKYGISYGNLSATQAKTVDTELKKLEKVYSAAANADSIRLQRLFFSIRVAASETTNRNLQRLLAEAADAIPAQELNGDELLACGVCPHVYQWAKQKCSTWADRDSSTKLRAFMIGTYALPEDESGYYCKICGEQIAYVDNETTMKFVGGERVVEIKEEDPLLQLIRAEAVAIISRFVRFPISISAKSLINSIVNGLRNKVGEEYVKASRSKTNTANDINDIMVLYTDIYIMAALCAMMLLNPNKIIFAKDIIESPKRAAAGTAKSRPSKSRVGAGGRARYRYNTSGGKFGGETTNDINIYESFLLNTAFIILLNTRSNLIARMSGLNKDILKQIFLKSAYKWARLHATKIKDKPKDKEIRFDAIYESPVYWYLYNIAMTKFLDKQIKKRPEFNEPSSVLGVTAVELKEKLLKNRGITDGFSVGKQWKFASSIYDEYTYLSAKAFVDYCITGDVFLRTIVPLDAAVVKYRQDNKRLAEIEKKVYDHIQTAGNRPIFTFKNAKDISFIDNTFDLSVLSTQPFYCANGEFHEVGAMVYTLPGGKSVEYSSKDITRLYNEDKKDMIAEIHDAEVTDFRCKKCKMLYSETLPLSDEAKHAADIHNTFFSYYEIRCPEGDLHLLKDGVCSKCGRKENDAAESYFKKYFKKYASVTKKIEEIRQHHMNRISHENKRADTFAVKPVVFEMKYTLEKTAELSKQLEVAYNLLCNIGLFEGYKYKEIESGKKNPSKEYEQGNPRYKCCYNRRLDYVMQVNRIFCSIKNHSKIAELPPILTAFLKENTMTVDTLAGKIGDIELAPIEPTMVNVTNDFYLVANILLERLADDILQIHKKSSVLAGFFCQHILSQEKMLSLATPILYLPPELRPDSGGESESETDGAVSGEDIQLVSADTSSQNEEQELNTNTADMEGYDVDDADAIWEQE